MVAEEEEEEEEAKVVAAKAEVAKVVIAAAAAAKPPNASLLYLPSVLPILPTCALTSPTSTSRCVGDQTRAHLRRRARRRE